MSIEERELHELHNGLEELLGPERAATLMSRLSPVSWPEVATRSDLAAVKADVKADVAAVRADIVATKLELEEKISSLGNTLRVEMGAQGDKLRAELATQMSRQTWAIIVAFVMAVAAVAGLS